ncbi:MAG: CoA-binding protein [Gammaproteobacteria bacterium CG_4_10_14_0_8_um_filter_38_16]|nr:MAG: CoA-binding protein [Gammaproteobacteria bacterium CG_4_10_14_0_8_um_filter_38_16]PJA03422.1 MAG: CoA-binding protein [Gammaproteobacteria bacterium CG_4_10_14_0_2_um_filter_38_22]PJB09903.1 MAG: CoA-binding protein [Gammaproteobacteria bacterium CG_4_9_14_3_um_filter_38_9]
MVWISDEFLEGKSDKVGLFFMSKAFAVVGASSDVKKYGNKVLRCYLQNKFKVYPVNPNEEKILGLDSIKSVTKLPSTVNSISIITPPNITELIVDAAIKKGIKNIWMQPGAESAFAIKKCQDHDVNVIANGPCILVELQFKD